MEDAKRLRIFGDAYQICAPWQRIEFEEAIRGLHFRQPELLPWARNWRARYRREPSLGTFEFGWLGIFVLVRRYVDDLSKRVAPPLKSLDEILKDGPDSKSSAEICEKCGAPVERSTGVPVCPETALRAALYQAKFLDEVRAEGIDDFFELCDDVDDMLWEHYAETDSVPESQHQDWHNEGEELEMQRQTCHWLLEQGIDDIGAGRALLLAKALELADHFGDPEGLLSPVKRIPKSVPKIGRNEPCPCGSGLKYKRCCLGRT